MSLKQISKRKVLLTALLLALLGGAGAILVQGRVQDPNVVRTPGVKSKDLSVISAEKDQRLTLGQGEKEKVIESKPIKADFQFNAVAPHWKEDHVEAEGRKVELRTSINNKDWSPWLEIEAVGPLRDNDPRPERMFSETPLLSDGKYFQYRVSLSRDSVTAPSPEIYDMKVSQIDSRQSKISALKEKVGKILGGPTAYAAQQHPRIITRSEWGSPDPYGNLYKGTNRHWPATYQPVKQVFIHHTVTANYERDPSAAVRAIWDFHANTRGYGDIGYNYLVDHHGNIYQGRLGGDNVVAGHVLGYNRGSLGVSMLGCFDSANQTCKNLNGGTTPPPNNKVMEGLASLLSYKTTSFEINPYGSNNFCDSGGTNCLNIPTITGHRSANLTTCPGDLTLARLQDIRNATVAKNAGGWTYSAKQLDYGATDLSTSSSRSVTLRFKNTGRVSWSNTSNQLSLYTMEPPGRASVFRDSSWLSSSKPAILNESSVAPGGTGSFTFVIRRPNLAPGYYQEGVTLITNNGITPGSFYSFPITLKCTIGQASNPRPDGSLITEAQTGRVYYLQDGKKRRITSPLAAVTNGHNLPYAVRVDSAEMALLADGESIFIREGTLLKSKESPSVYILDKTPTGDVRRSVPSVGAMATFGMKASQIFTISQSALSSYVAGPTLNASSNIPDGLLVKSPSSPDVYLSEAGTRRKVISPNVFASYGFSGAFINTVNGQKISQLSGGANFGLLRSGTLLKTPNSSNIYVSSTDNGAAGRRRISSPHAFLAAGYRPAAITSVSTSLLNSYSDSPVVDCYK